MKILNIIQCSDLGGMEQSTLETLVALKEEAGHEVAMLSLHPAGALAEKASGYGIPLAGCRRYRLFGIGNIFEILTAIKQFNPDCLLITGHNFGALSAAKFGGVPAYLSIHYPHFGRSRLLWVLFYKLSRQCCSGIRFVSEYIKGEVYDLLADYSNVFCFPDIIQEPGVLMEKERARQVFAIQPGELVVGNAGWLVPNKRFDIFLATAALVKRKIPESVFLIAGDGPERKKLEAMAEQLGLSQSVRFLGWRKDMLPFFSALDVLLFNSDFEAIGRTPLEALTHSVPVVASVKKGGLGEILRHERDCCLLDRHDPVLLSEEIVRLFRNPDFSTMRLRNGRKRVLSLCSKDGHLKHMEKFLGVEVSKK